ncbi:hypothetical protein ACFYO0_44495 [Streptomyces sp. NPDC006365]|uniref:hypothetical protein n=1 Tax=Streptomyces sp. NPDC006365 TaxID=3364744 RepID=UPI0036965FC7
MNAASKSLGRRRESPGRGRAVEVRGHNAEQPVAAAVRGAARIDRAVLAEHQPVWRFRLEVDKRLCLSQSLPAQVA